MTANTVTDITIAQPTSQVVVQTTLKAAGKTAVQAFASATALQTAAILLDWQQEVLKGNLPNMEDVNALGLLMYSGAFAALAAVISWVWNTFFAKTLPAGETVEAQVKP